MRMKNKPDALKGHGYSYDEFDNNKILDGKKKNHLPAMGWNSWNAFGSGNTEELTKQMADRMIELGLDKLGYKYVVLDDGCYMSERVNDRLSAEPVKFKNGFKALADYLHNKGLKFGMYNDIGTNLCAGAAVGTFAHEALDAASYAEWGIDFIKVDNCYYMWDDATFADEKNIKYTYTPIIKKVELRAQDSTVYECSFDDEKGLGTKDGTAPLHSPVGVLCDEKEIDLSNISAGAYELIIGCEHKEAAETGKWIQVAVGRGESSRLIFDDFAVDDNNTVSQFELKLQLELKADDDVIRIMNHRRQENTLDSYSTFLEELNKAKPGHDIIYSICEWGKTQPHRWAYKVGDSWRILNDITFNVGSDGDPGKANWEDEYTTSVCSQYNKCVIMDEFAGLSKGWNDPDMLVVGMDGLSNVQYRTHMVMWCMMNSPLMLGMDLRRVNKGDAIYEIIADEDLIALNQDALGIQAKRAKIVSRDHTYTQPDKEYVRDNDRVDILVKPLSDASVAISFINLSSQDMTGEISISFDEIQDTLSRQNQTIQFAGDSSSYVSYNLADKSSTPVTDKKITINRLAAYDNYTVKLKRI